MNTVWMLVALLGFAGWTVTLIALMRNILPMANALSALQKISGFVDDRIAAQLERAKRVWDAKGMPTSKIEGPPKPQRVSSGNDIMDNLFAGVPMEAFGEQPDASGDVEKYE